MGEPSGEKKGVEKLLEKIPVETCWEITAKALNRLMIIRDRKHVMPLMGIGEGIIAPVSAWEKWREMASDKGFYEHYTKFTSWVKETFNIPVKDAVGAAKLRIVVVTLHQGPEFIAEIYEATPERTVVRITKCAWWEMYNELEVDPEFRICDVVHQVNWEAGLKAINPQLTTTLTKALPRGDPYCEDVIEFKEE